MGNYIETSPDLINRMVEEGHIVGNHTYHHPDMSKYRTLPRFKKVGGFRGIISTDNMGQEMQNSIVLPKENSVKAI